MTSDTTEGSSESSSESTAAHSIVADVDLWVFVALLLSCFVINIRHTVKIPTSALLMLAGIILRAAGQYIGSLGDSLKVIDNIEADTILLIFLPALISQCAFDTDWYTFKREMGQIVLLATSAVVVASILTAVVIRHILGFANVFNWYAALMLGAILSATDHVAVVSQLKEVNADYRLETLIQGETLVNEGSVIVIFTAMMKGAIESAADSKEIAELFFRLSLGGITLGLAFSFGVSIWLKRLVNQPILETLLTVVTTYFLFFTADATSVHFSGAIGTVTFGLYMSAYGKILISPLCQKTLYEFWELMATCFECLILILGGMLMGLFLIDFQSLEYSDIGALFGLFVLLHCVRAVTVLVHWPFLRRMGYGCTFKEMIVLVVGALKGTISIALALMVYHNPDFDRRIRDLVLFWSVGVSALSVTFDSLLLTWTVRYLGLESMTDVQENMLVSVTTSILQTSEKSMEKMKIDEDYAMVNWDEIEKIAGPSSLFNDMLKATKIGNRMLKNGVTGSTTEVLGKFKQAVKITDYDIVLETRKRYYTTLKGLYWDHFEHRDSFGESAVLLIESANRGLDCEREEMNDWAWVYRSVYPQRLMRFLHIAGRLPLIGRFFKTSEYDYITRAYDVTRNFISAHEEAKTLLDDMEIDIKDEVFKEVMKEQELQVGIARRFLTENITDIYPEVYTFVQTKQASSRILYREKKSIEKAYKQGVITEIEYIALIESVKKKINKLRSMPPPKTPTFREMLESCFLFRDLPLDLLDHLEHAAKEEIVKKSEVIFACKAEVKGAYIVLKGRVRELGKGFEKDHFPGDVVGLQYLLPNYLRTKTYAQALILTTLGFVPYSEIRLLLANEEFEQKLWLRGLKSAVIVSKEAFGPLGLIEPAKLDVILANCEFVKTVEGHSVDLRNGAILLMGRLSNGFRAFAFIEAREGGQAKAVEDCALLLFTEEFGAFVRKNPTDLRRALYKFEQHGSHRRIQLAGIGGTADAPSPQVTSGQRSSEDAKEKDDLLGTERRPLPAISEVDDPAAKHDIVARIRHNYKKSQVTVADSYRSLDEDWKDPGK